MGQGLFCERALVCAFGRTVQVPVAWGLIRPCQLRRLRHRCRGDGNEKGDRVAPMTVVGCRVSRDNQGPGGTDEGQRVHQNRVGNGERAPNAQRPVTRGARLSSHV